MTSQNETRRAGGAPGLRKSSFLAGLDNRDIPPKLLLAQGVISRKPRTVREVRSKWLSARLHALGPKPLFHFLDELERGADLRAALARYAALPADFIRIYHGDRFAPALHTIAGSER
jgi:hypothetical protein